MKHLLILLAVATSFCATIQARTVKGTVSSGKKNLSGVIVTDGKSFTTTDKKGNFEMDICKEAEFVYIVTPSGYAADWSTGVPQFYQKAAGKDIFNFDLKKLPDSKSTYNILAVGDPQPRREKHIAEFAKKPLDDLAQTGASLKGQVVGIALGDICFDVFPLMDRWKEEIPRAGFPFYTVVGNHDHDRNFNNDMQAIGGYREHFGPENHAFRIGKDLVILLDNIIYHSRSGYELGYTEEIIEWVSGLMQYIPKNADIYVAQHSSANGRHYTGDMITRYNELIDALKGHKVTFLSGHNHTSGNFEYAPGITEHNIAAICGTWWDIYHCTDGTPRGFKVFTKNGNNLQWYYKSIGKDRNHQYEIYRPQEQTTPEPTQPSPVTMQYAAVENVTEATLKADIATKLEVPEGTTLEISGVLNLSVPGKYQITCKWGENEQAVAVWVYGNSASFTLNGKPLTDGNVSMTFLDAQASEDFTKGVAVVDSLGNALQFELDDRNMAFANKPGSYLAYYHATDAVGQVFTVRVIYEVEFDYNIQATNVTALDGDASVTVPVDFDGATNVWLEDSNGKKIDAKYYQITLDAIVLSKEYYAANAGSRIRLRVSSVSGYADFYLSVLDKKESEQYMQQKIASLVSVRSSTYGSFKAVTQAPAGITFSYGFHYKKTGTASIDQSALIWDTKGDYGLVSFDFYVYDVKTKDGAAYHELELQLFNGVQFVSVTDDQGNAVPVVYKSNKPNVALAKGKVYHIVLDMTESILPELYFCWGNRVCEVYFYNFKLEAPRFTYVVDNATQTIVCKKSGETLGYFAWPTVTKLDGDRLIAVASGFRKAHIDTESKVAVWYSEDGGKTWSEPQVLVDTLLDDRDSGVVYWNGKIIVSWFCASKAYYLNNNASKYSEWASTIPDDYDTKYMGGNYIISEDGGKTGSEIYTLPEGMFTPHGLIVNPEGGLTSVGYAKYDKVNKTWGTGIAVRTTTGEMDENGFIWSEAIVIATDKEQNESTGWDFQEPYGIYNDDGVLIVVMRANKGLYQCELYPGETKFTAWRKIAFVQETPAHMIEHSSGVMIMTYGYRGLYIDPLTGKTVSYLDRNEDSTLGIRARLSYDGGLTWTRELILSYGLYPASNSSDWGYTSTVELEDGKLLTLFYQRTGSETMASIYQIVWELPEAITGEVTFTLANGQNSLTDDGAFLGTVTGKVGEEINFTAPTKDGYQLKGWYLDYACSIPFTGTEYSQDLILYAKWGK